MPKSYFDWFKETFQIEQTKLVNTLIINESVNKIKTYHYPEYYISTFDFCLKNDVDKDNLINKHIEIIKREKKILADVCDNTDNESADIFYNAEKIKQAKECIQEIEIQSEILNLIKSNLFLLANNCKWFPFNNNTLFNIFNFVRLPIISYENNFWLGILSDKIKYQRQISFFSVLKQYEIPDDTNLIYTKLHAWIDIEYNKYTVNEAIIDYQKPNFDVLRTIIRQMAKQKVFDSWDKAYTSLHNSEI